MKNLLYIVALVLVIGWLVGYFAYGVDSLIHALLVIAIVVIVFNVLTGRKIV